MLTNSWQKEDDMLNHVNININKQLTFDQIVNNKQPKSKQIADESKQTAA